MAKASKSKAEVPEQSVETIVRDPLELRSRFIQPLAEIVDGCPDEKKQDLTLAILLQIREVLGFMDAARQQDRKSAANPSASADRFSA